MGIDWYLILFLQELERQELEIQSSSNSELDAEVRRLEDQITNGYDGQTVSDELDRLLSESVEKIDSAKGVICCCSQHYDYFLQHGVAIIFLFFIWWWKQ